MQAENGCKRLNIMKCVSPSMYLYFNEFNYFRDKKHHLENIQNIFMSMCMNDMFFLVKT